VGKGSTFRIHLPALSADHAKTSTRQVAAGDRQPAAS